MEARAASVDPISAQQLVARYVALVEEQTQGGSFPAPTSTLPASKPAIKSAISVVFAAMSSTGQLTPELRSFLEEAYVALANYVDEEVAAVAAEHRRASEMLEATAGQPRDRFTTPHWSVVQRTSRLAGEIARASADEAAALRTEFQALVAASR